MRKAVLLLISFIYCIVCTGQKKKIVVKVTPTYKLTQTEFFYVLGDQRIGVVVYKYNNNPSVSMITLHDDEITAAEVSKEVLRKTGGTLIKLNNNKKRLVRFIYNDAVYEFDPNRMFTNTGIINSLLKYNCYSPEVVPKIKGFAKFILSKIPVASTTLIALHNNHEGNYSIATYDNGTLNKDKTALYIDSSHDKDDFFLTTDEIAYNKIRGFGYNVILQNNMLANDDGSLSVYYGKKAKSYINVEAQHGKSEEQLQMLAVALNPPKRKNVNAVVYNYQLNDSVDTKTFRNLKIYFGDKQVGTLLYSAYPVLNKKTFGQLEIDRNFPLWSNADFFYIQKKTGNKLEIRIDPTRKKMPVDRMKETVAIIIRK